MLAALATWAGLIAYPYLPSVASILVLIVAGFSVFLGVRGTFTPRDVTDGGALLLVGLGFLGFGLTIQLSIVNMYLFVTLAIITDQMMRFRKTVTPLEISSAETISLRGFRSVYLSFLIRASTFGFLVFLLSTVLLAAAPRAIVEFSSQITAFLLALVTLLSLVMIAKWRR